MRITRRLSAVIKLLKPITVLGEDCNIINVNCVANEYKQKLFFFILLLTVDKSIKINLVDRNVYDLFLDENTMDEIFYVLT